MQVVNLGMWESFKDRYFYFVSFIIIPYFRRVLRFLALPYCYLFLVNWKYCSRNKLQVVGDLLYIFFILKYFPDNYSICRLWEKDRSEWIYYYGSNYDPYQRRQLRKEVQKAEYTVLFEDKNVCYQLCQAGSLPLPKQYSCVFGYQDALNDLKEILKSNPNEKIIIKPVNGKGGTGITLGYLKNNEIVTRVTSENVYSDQLNEKCLFVLQSYISQHKDLDCFSESINTVRIVTLFTKDSEILILGALMRFGVEDNFVDNTSKGGVAVGIDIHTGRLNQSGYDFSSTMWDKHPTSKKEFHNFKIPHWSKVVSLAEKTHHHFNYYKLLGHDIAITENEAVIIELNSIYDNAHLEMCSGPIFKNDAVLREYGKYGLLINGKQRKLFKSLISKRSL